MKSIKRTNLYFVMEILLIMLMIADASGQPFAKKSRPAYLDSTLSIERRVNDLLKRMTLAEKIAQLESDIRDVDEKPIPRDTGLGGLGPVLRSLTAHEAAEKANAIQRAAAGKTRLGIPLIIHDEGLHGLVGKGATSFPQAIALASTWDPGLMQRVATVIGKETRSRGIRQLLSPVINIARDVRWGRVEETYGEDPYLTARMGVAFCKGIEGEGVITTPKHFAANVGDGGRDSYPIHFSERLLRETYFPAFKACFQEAHAGSVMAAYNALDGLPCSANPWLLTDVLRKEWGFQGFVVSDYGSVSGIMSMHHTAATEKEAAEQAVNSGLDVELPGIYIYGKPLFQAVNEGLVSTATIEKSARRVLSAKFRLGLFDNRYVDPQQADKLNDSPDHRALALEAAREGIVLLKNDHNMLPLNKDVKSIAVIGPNGDAARLGGYSGFGTKVVTLLEGIRNKVPSSTIVTYAKGTELRGNILPPIPEAYLIPSDTLFGSHGLRGEYFNSMDLSGKPALVRTDKQIYFDWGGGPPDSSVHADHFSVRWTGTLVPPVSRDYKLSVTSDDGVRLYLDGNLLINSWFDRGPASDVVTVSLQAGRRYDIRMEYYENEGGAVAGLGWDYKMAVDSVLQEAVSLAKRSDVAIVAAGIIEGEGSDRSNLDLPANQEELIRAVRETGTPVVVVLINGSAVTMNNWMSKANAIVEAWYPGEEGGTAIADVLFGDYNPAGRLPVTFPQFVGQVPLYYNHKPTGRGDDYVDLSGKALFPFGYGMSYTKFEYSNLQIDSQHTQQIKGLRVRISADIRNVGSRAGEEVVQLYLRDTVASVTRPVKELKGFRRIMLQPGEKKSVTFELTRDDLAFYDRHMKLTVEPRKTIVMVGSSSDDIRLRGEFVIAK